MSSVEQKLKEFQEKLQERCELAERYAKDYDGYFNKSLYVLEERCTESNKKDMFEAIKTYFALRKREYDVDEAVKYAVKFHEDIWGLTIELPKEKVEAMRYGFYETRGGRQIPALRAYYQLRRKRPHKTEEGVRHAITIILSPKETRVREKRR